MRAGVSLGCISSAVQHSRATYTGETGGHIGLGGDGRSQDASSGVGVPHSKAGFFFCQAIPGQLIRKERDGRESTGLEGEKDSERLGEKETS